MKGVTRRKLLLSTICRKPVGELSSVIKNEIAILLRGLLALVGNTAPLKQAASDDLGSLRFSRHNHRFAQTIKKFLKTVEVPLILRSHFVQQRGKGYR
jgi:hypothetical protein